MAKENLTKKSEGYIKIFRSLKDHWLWQDEKKLKWWLDILLTVNHTDKKVQIGFELIECKRGEAIRSLETWAKTWNVDKSTVRRFFKMLTDDKMICIENLKKTTRLKVLQYEVFNDWRHGKQLTSNSETTPEQLRDNPNNKGNNDNNVKNVYRASPEKEKQFKEFKEWVKENAPRVEQMQQPLTIEEYFKLIDRYGKIGYMLKKMHNNKPLLQKNVSTYLTVINWIENEEQRKAS